MKKETQIILGLGLLLVLVFLGWSAYRTDSNDQVQSAQEETFTINGEKILLVNGTYEREVAPGSAARVTTAYFGNEVQGDFNSDGKIDRAFIVTQTASGSGTFFYLATTLGGEAVLLGDRIAPQTTEWRSGSIVVNYADRKPGEPMTAAPREGVTRYFQLQGNALVEVPSPSTGVVPGDSSAAGGTVLTTGERCQQEGGTWSAEFNECTGVGETSCLALGGTFNECASPCRNDPKAEVCIMMCVQVCEFK